MTLAEAESLVDRTFYNTCQLTVARVFRNEAVGCDYVELRRAGEDEAWTWPLSRFSEWHAQATEVVGALLSDNWLRSIGGKYDKHGACWNFQYSWNTLHVRSNGQCWITSSSRYGGKVSVMRNLRTQCEFTELCRLFGFPLEEMRDGM